MASYTESGRGVEAAGTWNDGTSFFPAGAGTRYGLVFSGVTERVRTSVASLALPLDTNSAEGAVLSARVLVPRRVGFTGFSSSVMPSQQLVTPKAAEVTVPAGTADLELDIATQLLAAQGQVGFSGTLGLVLRLSSGSLTFGDSATLETTEGPFFTGLRGPWKAQSRADECPKCGGKSVRETWVRDGYTRQLVCPSCYDPPDRTRHRRAGRERPPIGEG